MSLFALRLFLTPEFHAWRDTLDKAADSRLEVRIERLQSGHFGDSRSLGNGLFELRWRNGMRVYYTRKRIRDIDSIVLHGGFKGTQYADIDKARALKIRYEQRFGHEDKDA
ncbi:MAG: type II toxin-antitoxin system RelE/ParE family toxin [Elusimicrobia bacterium]|nr:type II toxin-antitoxin system RelE/ParE family toxin [Elusimicrobiota bacterium]